MPRGEGSSPVGSRVPMRLMLGPFITSTERFPERVIVRVRYERLEVE